MANRGLGHALADGLVDRAQLFAPSCPPRRRGWPDRSPRRAEQIAQRLRDAILGDQLLDIEIDRRRLDALAILGRRDDALGKSRLRHASAMRATVNRGLMFGDHERALGNVENLPLFDSRRRPRIERRTAMAASAGLVSNHGVGMRHLPQSPACVARLAAARLAGTTAKTSLDREVSSSARRSKAAWSYSNCPNPIGDEDRPPPPEAPLSPPSAKLSTPRLRRG